MVLVFWITAVLMAYIYVGYPLLARIAAKMVSHKINRGPVRPTVTVVVTAYNEQKGISAKLDNLFALNYPPELLSIIVASDASSDETDNIVRAYSNSTVQLLRVEGRVGKTACQNAAIKAAPGEIVVFTDATTQIDSDALIAMVENFADPKIGCVAGHLVYVDKDRSLTGAGGTAYWAYELSLRQAETQLSSLVGVSGCLYAVRKSAYREISPDLISDFVIALTMVEQGLRTILEPGAICREETLAKPKQELSMRVRVAIRSITALVSARRVLNPFKYGVFSWQLWSHKVLRYASPIIWSVLLIVSAVLSLENGFYRLAFLAQMIVIFAGLVGWFSRQQKPALLAKAYYFLLTNVASLVAIGRYLRGDRVTVWKTVR